MEPVTDAQQDLLRGIEPTIALNLDILLHAQEAIELLAETVSAEQQSLQILSSVGDG